MNMPSTQSAAKSFKNAASKEAAVPPAAPSIRDEDDEIAPEYSTEIEYIEALVTMKPGSSTVVDVPEWEIDVLREIHGPESVKVLNSHFIDYPHNAAIAFQYLRNKYKTREQEDVIKQLFPRLKDFAKSTGLPYKALDEASATTQQSHVVVNEPLKRERSTKQRAAGSGASGSAGE
jgi:hypothetical protein